MKNVTVALAALIVLSAPMATVSVAANASVPGHGAQQSEIMDYEQVIGGMKVTFKFVSMKEHLQKAKIQAPAGMKETHHLKVDFLNAKTGEPFTEGEARVKIQGPDNADQVKDLMAMNNRFCADFDLSKKGKYGVITKFQLKGGDVQAVKFWYTAK